MDRDLLDGLDVAVLAVNEHELKEMISVITHAGLLYADLTHLSRPGSIKLA